MSEQRWDLPPRWVEGVKETIERLVAEGDSMDFRAVYRKAGEPYGPEDQGVVLWTQENMLSRIEEWRKMGKEEKARHIERMLESGRLGRRKGSKE